VSGKGYPPLSQWQREYDEREHRAIIRKRTRALLLIVCVFLIGFAGSSLLMGALSCPR
jgi:hypothetical protein